MVKTMNLLEILFWPIKLIFGLALLVLRIVGKLIGAFIGIGILILGILLSATLIGAIIGIPLIFLGGILIVQAIF
jgi:hypothetical protein